MPSPYTTCLLSQWGKEVLAGERCSRAIDAPFFQLRTAHHSVPKPKDLHRSSSIAWPDQPKKAAHVRRNNQQAGMSNRMLGDSQTCCSHTRPSRRAAASDSTAGVVGFRV